MAETTGKICITQETKDKSLEALHDVEEHLIAINKRVIKKGRAHIRESPLRGLLSKDIRTIIKKDDGKFCGPFKEELQSVKSSIREIEKIPVCKQRRG